MSFRKIHYKADTEPTLCGVHHYKQREGLQTTDDKTLVTFGNCSRKIVVRNIYPSHDRRVKKQSVESVPQRRKEQ